MSTKQIIEEIRNICLEHNVLFEMIDVITPNCKSFMTSIEDIRDNISKIKSLRLLSVEPRDYSTQGDFILRGELEYVITG